MLILKYSILQIGLLEGNIYNLTFVAMMYFLLTLSLINDIKEKYKLNLLCYSTRLSLLLYNLKLYEVELKKPEEILNILETKAKSLFTIMLP